ARSTSPYHIYIYKYINTLCSTWNIAIRVELRVFAEGRRIDRGWHSAVPASLFLLQLIALPLACRVAGPGFFPSPGYGRASLRVFGLRQAGRRFASGVPDCGRKGPVKQLYLPGAAA